MDLSSLKADPNSSWGPEGENRRDGASEPFSLMCMCPSLQSSRSSTSCGIQADIFGYAIIYKHSQRKTLESMKNDGGQNTTRKLQKCQTKTLESSHKIENGVHAA